VVPISVHYSTSVQRALNFTQASIVTQATSTTGKGTIVFSIDVNNSSVSEQIFK